MPPFLPLRLLFSGGGTGGHVTPALAVSHALRERYPDARFCYVGVRGRAEQVMVPRDEIWKAMLAPGSGGEPPQATLKLVRSRAFTSPRHPVAFLRFCIDVGLGTLASVGILLRFRPQLVVATGGYGSAPVIFATWLLRALRLAHTRVLLHEQNARLGRLNALAASRVADQVGTCFPNVAGIPRSKLREVGYPVRGSITAHDEEGDAEEQRRAREALGLPAEARVIFAFGGSQGARTINRAMVDALPTLLADPRVHVIHGTGRQAPGAPYDGARDVQDRLAKLEGLPSDWVARYRHEVFIYDMRAVYAASDVVVCRGGAGSLKEVSACGRAAVVIPKANVAGEHQAVNARAMERLGAARVVYERIALHGEDAVPWVDGAELAALLIELIEDPVALARMGRAGRADHDPRTLKNMADLADFLLGRGQLPELAAAAEAGPGARDIMPLGSNALVLLLERIHGGQAEPLNDGERRLVLYKTDGLLAGAGYTSRCRGCRAAGWGGIEERIPVLLAYATAKRGGRYRKQPLVRRDAYVGLGLVAEPSAEVLDVLAQGLADPYFEARAQAARAIGRIARRAGATEVMARFIPPLLALLSNRCFESRMEALTALGELITDVEAALPALRSRRYEPNWKVRAALLGCYQRLLERGVMPVELVEAEGSAVLSTGTGYTATFSIKQAFADLREATTAAGGR